MFKYTKAAGLAMLMGCGAVQASTVTIGGFTFDESAFADNAEIVATNGSIAAVNPGAGTDGDLTTATNLNDSVVEIFFENNVLINGPGADLVVFQGTNNNTIVLRDVPGPGTTLAGTLNFIPSSDPTNPSGFALNAATYDLSDLGYAEGVEFTDGLFLRRGGIFSTVWDVAALNSRAVVIDPGPGTIPLPAGLPLLMGALAVFGWMRRRA